MFKGHRSELSLFAILYFALADFTKNPAVRLTCTSTPNKYKPKQFLDKLDHRCVVYLCTREAKFWTSREIRFLKSRVFDFISPRFFRNSTTKILFAPRLNCKILRANMSKSLRDILFSDIYFLFGLKDTRRKEFVPSRSEFRRFSFAHDILKGSSIANVNNIE